MKAISELVIHVFDLVEAEGKTLLHVVRNEASRARTTVANMALAIGVLVVAVPLLVSGLWLMAAGLMWWLETLVGRPLAAGITGLVLVLFAVAGVAVFKKLTSKAQS